jgi:NAD(P)H-dependent flavin oxidoreductase YrpB (nitropropane dioxygenase family)
MRHDPLLLAACAESDAAQRGPLPYLSSWRARRIEQIFADLISGPLAHLPSGDFNANAAWLTCAAIAHNLLRDLGVMASGQVVGLIDDLPTCVELITRVMAEAEATFDQLSTLHSP